MPRNRPGSWTGAVTLPDVAPERLGALRRMKFFAAGMLVAAAVVFVVSASSDTDKGVWGSVQAAAEAAMVGGLADWFAVTALFRYPLGIPIPHTAIIPRKKDQIGEAWPVRAAELPDRDGRGRADPVRGDPAPGRGLARRSRAAGGSSRRPGGALQGTATVMTTTRSGTPSRRSPRPGCVNPGGARGGPGDRRGRRVRTAPGGIDRRVARGSCGS